MTIECPHCLTRFRLDPAQLSDSRSMLKCARCRRVFPAPGRSQPARPRAKPAPPEQNLSFDFDEDDDEWRAPELAPEGVPEEEFLLNAPADEPRAEPAPPAAAVPAAAPTLTGRRKNEPLDLVRDDDDGDDESDDDDDEDERSATRRSGGISLRSVFVFLVLVVGAYGALTWTLLDDPYWAARLTQTLPVIGKEVRERTLIGQDVALIEVQGRYERTKEGKLVFIVTGKAVNHSAQSLRGVQIVSRLYGPADRPLDEQVTACGNPMEAHISDLSIHQVAILRGIKPPPDFGVQPGGQCPFVAIFLDVPAATGAFSTEVARAQRQV
jgi:predicted Zn finger-like uncharacterized protein